MRNRFFSTSILVLLLLVACDEQDVDLLPGSVYSVTTTEGEGFVIFERMSDSQWRGVYYLSKGQLMAERRNVILKNGKELTLVDETGNSIPILSYKLYEEPEFKDFPETWNYRDSIYTVAVDTNLVYGTAQGYWISYPDTGGTYQEIFDAKKQELSQEKRDLDLTMDIYLPNDNKDVSRPLLVLVHGGAFFNGDKTDLGFPIWAHNFASRGYVVASVNYRLGFKKKLASVKRAGFYAVQDVDAAIRYIIHKKDYAVDPERVFIAGTSAGGITALNVAFMSDEDIPSEAKDEGGIKAVNPDLKELYVIRAVGNMWGAVNSLSILDNAPSSVISFHSTGDPVVPYDEGHPFKKVFLNWLVFPTMYGSKKITEYLGDQRAIFKDYNLPDRHSLHLDEDENGNFILSPRFYEIDSVMCGFFSNKMLPSPVVFKHNENSPTFQIFSTDLDSGFWHVEGGVIMEQEDSRAVILLFPDEASHSVVVSGKYKSGLTFRHKWSL